MTHAQITQCPHCQTRFRVSQTQLAAAHGTVRCGACFKVFNAGSSAADAQTLSPTAQDFAAPAVAASASIAAAPATPSPAPSAEQTLWIHDDLDLDILDQELAKLEQEERSLPNAPIDTLSALDELASASRQAEQETFSALDALDAPAPALSHATPTAFEFDDEPLPLPAHTPPKHWGKTVAWTLLSVLAALALLGQYTYYHFDTLARQPDTRALLERLCPVVGCTLPAKVDISQLRSSNLVVRAHPQFSGALQLDAIIYNRAAFAQPFPVLDVRFSDTQGQVKASRQFQPSEYLAGELAGQALMPPQTPIRIALEILDPGHSAQSYSLNFLSP